MWLVFHNHVTLSPTAQGVVPFFMSDVQARLNPRRSLESNGQLETCTPIHSSVSINFCLRNAALNKQKLIDTGDSLVVTREMGER